MRRTMGIIAAAFATLLVIGACGAAVESSRETAVSVPEGDQPSPTATTPDVATTAPAGEPGTEPPSASAEEPPADPTTPDDEPEESGGAVQPSPETPVEQPAVPEVDEAELDQIIADLDALLANLSNSFNQTEGDVNP